MSDEFNSKKISFIDIPEGENRRAKLYASDLEALRKLATSSVWLRAFKDKKPGSADLLNARKAHISYRESV